MVELQWLSANNRILIGSLLLLWIVAVAIECSNLTKRDVVHRIVLKTGKKHKVNKHHLHHSYKTDQDSRKSKIHKHRYTHGDHIESDESTSDSHENSWESRKKGRPDNKREENSVESTKEHSSEYSFEDNSDNIRHKKERPERQNFHRFHKFNADIYADESRLPEPSKIQYSIADDWATSLDDVPASPEMKSKKKLKKYQTSFIDFTTSFPVKSPPSFQFSAYEPLYASLPTLPNMPTFSNAFENNKKTNYAESQPLTFSPQLPVLQPKPVNQFTNLLPIEATVPFKLNLSNNYEVNEKGIIDVQPMSSLTSPSSFQKVIPITFQKSATIMTVNSTNPSALHSGLTFKDIKKLAPTRSSKKRSRNNGSI